MLTENLLTGTKDLTNPYMIIELQSEKYMGFTVARANASGLENYQNVIGYAFSNYESGATYTFSFFAKGTGKVACFFYEGLDVKELMNSQGSYNENRPDGSSTMNLTPDWKQYWVWWTLKEGDASARKIVLIRANQGNDVWACALKLERGENHNPIWTPALEEMIFTKSELETYLDDYMKRKGATT